MKKTLKIILIVLCVMIVLFFAIRNNLPNLIPYEGRKLALQEFAQEGEIHTGQLGPDVYYDFNINTGVMVIYGSGITYVATTASSSNYLIEEVDESRFDETGREHFPPDDWNDYIISPVRQEDMENPLRKVVIKNGVTGIESGIFRSCANLQEVYFPASVEYVGMTMAYDLENVTFYFDGDAPKDHLPEENGRETTIALNCRYITIVHRPDTVGWDSGAWLRYDDPDSGFTGFAVIERPYQSDLFGG